VRLLRRLADALPGQEGEDDLAVRRVDRVVVLVLDRGAQVRAAVAATFGGEMLPL
jgi:hypothetical protein